MDLIIRSVTSQDFESIDSLLRQFALEEGLHPDTIKLDESSFLKYGFGPDKCFYCDLGSVNGNAISYTMYSIRFSGVAGMPILYLEDIFVSAEYRNHGFGKMLMDHTVSFAIKHDCSRLEWVVESRNISAQMFYKNLGAELRKDLIVSRFDIANS